MNINIRFIIISLVMSILITSSFTYAKKNITITKAKPSLEIQIKEMENKDGIEGIAVTFFIKAKPGDVWKWVRDVDHLGKLFPAVKKVIQVKNVNSGTIIWEYHLSSTLGTKILKVKRSINDKKFSVKWIRTEGDLKYYAGSWDLTTRIQYPGWVEVRYSNFINASAFIPYFIVKSNSISNVKAMAPALRKLVAKTQK